MPNLFTVKNQKMNKSILNMNHEVVILAKAFTCRPNLRTNQQHFGCFGMTLNYPINEAQVGQQNSYCELYSTVRTSNGRKLTSLTRVLKRHHKPPQLTTTLSKWPLSSTLQLLPMLSKLLSTRPTTDRRTMRHACRALKLDEETQK